MESVREWEMQFTGKCPDGKCQWEMQFTGKCPDGKCQGVGDAVYR